MKTYSVKTGDTLSGIARRYGVTLEALRRANPQITDINLLRPKQRVVIPDAEVRPEPSAEPASTVSVPPDVLGFIPLTAQQLCEIVTTLSHYKAASLIEALNEAMQEAETTTPARQAAFLAQVAHETGGFRWFRELGRASYFQRYEGRTDLGNTQPGDGPRFRGRGFIQITGRANYTKASEALGLDLLSEPHLAETPAIGARIAAWYWRSRNLNVYADRGDFVTITRRINGGLNGLADRQAYHERAKNVLSHPAPAIRGDSDDRSDRSSRERGGFRRGRRRAAQPAPQGAVRHA